MDEQWIGKGVDLNCAELGVFQGVIESVHLEEQTITINKVIQNGVPSVMSAVTIEARDIKSIDFVEIPNSVGSQSQKQATSTITTVAKKKVRPVAESLVVNKSSFVNTGNGSNNQSRKHQQSPFDNRQSTAGYNSHTSRQRHFQRDEDCFDIDMNMMHTKEFDFERNLALFDKRRVLEEIESNQPDVVRLIDHNRRGGNGNGTKTKVAAVASTGSVPKSNGGGGGGAAMSKLLATATNNVPPPVPKTEPKYRNDQNVLVSEPTQYHLISLEEAPMGKLSYGVFYVGTIHSTLPPFF